MDKKENTNATPSKPKLVMELYHFPGSGEYEPAAVYATSQEEAKKVWEKERKAINK